MDLISVIIPVYNGEKTIGGTLRSVFAQTYTDIEVIVINDGSTDPTLDIVNGFSDDRLKIYSFKNAGLSSSRNRGIKKASGEYISFIDADDLWAPDKLEAQLNALKKDLSADVAYSWTDMIDGKGRVIRKGRHPVFRGDIYKDLLAANIVESGSNILARRSAVESVGYFDETLSSSEDWDYYVRLSKEHRFVNVPRVQVYYRHGRTNLSCDIVNMEREAVRVVEKAFGSAPKELAYLKCKTLAWVSGYLCVKSARNGAICRSVVFLFRSVIFCIKYLMMLIVGHKNV